MYALTATSVVKYMYSVRAVKYMYSVHVCAMHSSRTTAVMYVAAWVSALQTYMYMYRIPNVVTRLLLPHGCVYGDQL